MDVMDISAGNAIGGAAAVADTPEEVLARVPRPSADGASSKALKASRVSARILPLPHAKVPIVKWTDRQTGTQLDACFNNVDGLVATAALARVSAAMPELRPLVLVLKSQLMMLEAKHMIWV